MDFKRELRRFFRWISVLPLMRLRILLGAFGNLLKTQLRLACRCEAGAYLAMRSLNTVRGNVDFGKC